MTQQRLLPIKHGYNFRDLGGYQTSDGHTVKWHRLIRSGALNNLDEQDQEALVAIPVTVDIDLRSKPEITAAQVLPPPCLQHRRYQCLSQ